MCNDDLEIKKDKEQIMYQTIFNEALTKLRLVVSATGNEHLMRAIAKIMFDFSDALKSNNLLTDKEQENDSKHSLQNIQRAD